MPQSSVRNDAVLLGRLTMCLYSSHTVRCAVLVPAHRSLTRCLRQDRDDGSDFKLFVASTHSGLRDAYEKGQEGTQWQGHLKTSPKKHAALPEMGSDDSPSVHSDEMTSNSTMSGSSSSADSGFARPKGRGPAGRHNLPPLSLVGAAFDTKRYLPYAGQLVCGLLVEWNKEGRPADRLSAKLSSQCVLCANCKHAEWLLFVPSAGGFFRGVQHANENGSRARFWRLHAVELNLFQLAFVRMIGMYNDGHPVLAESGLSHWSA
jgi:hypothetical protein